MNANEFNLATRAWLDDGPTRMSDRALLSALEEIHTTRQRRAMRPAWRATPMSIFASLATAAVLVVAVGLLAVVVSRQPDGSNVGGPPTATPAQSSDSPVRRTPFVSKTNGFAVRYADRGAGTLEPAKELWVSGNKGARNAFDVVETGLGAVFYGASTQIPARLIPEGLLGGQWVDDEWVDAVVWHATDCDLAPRSQQAEITIDGKLGRISECSGEPGEIVATVVADERLYQFSLVHSRDDARAVFDAFEDTIRLTPETPYFFANLTTPFVSATNGFSMKYMYRGEGSSTPAKRLWDPRTEGAGDAFDLVETGYGAAFWGASAEIPDGVAVDAWVDSIIENLPGGCGVPPSQQAEITIDGQSGRIAECGPIEATVVYGGRLYLFTVSHSRHPDDARAFFDAWIATIDLTPEIAPVP